LVHPEVVSGLVLLNTPPQPRSTTPPREIWKTIREKTGSRFYQEYFTSEQAIVELNRDIRQTLLSTMYSISGSAIAAHRWRSLIGPSEGFLQTVHEPRQPPKWLSTTALGHYVSEYGRHGFGGALMPYRSREHSWKISAHLQGCHPPHAALFIGGALDPALERLEPALKALDKTLPQLRGREMLPGAGHNLPEEMPHETLKLMLPFMEMLVAQ
jgi:pimeloyl-ACP methyl ester carboxylesterase